MSLKKAPRAGLVIIYIRLPICISSSPKYRGSLALKEWIFDGIYSYVYTLEYLLDDHCSFRISTHVEWHTEELCLYLSCYEAFR